MVISLEQTPTVEFGAYFLFVRTVLINSVLQMVLTLLEQHHQPLTAGLLLKWNFSNENILNPVYTPGPNEKLIGASSTLTLSVNAEIV